jgi:hypothetical protein
MTARESPQLDALITFVCAENRVCPEPRWWNELWQMLPNKRRDARRWIPPLPLILGGWYYTSDAEKQERSLSHIRYAAEHGMLGGVDRFVRSLSDSDDQWHYHR